MVARCVREDQGLPANMHDVTRALQTCLGCVYPACDCNVIAIGPGCSQGVLCDMARNGDDSQLVLLEQHTMS